MSKAVLTAAKELIDSGKYHEAATILRTLPDDPTAQKWLANLEAKYLPKAPTGPTSVGRTAMEMTAYEAKRLREAKASKRPNRLRGCLVVLLVLGVLYVVSQSGRSSSVNRSTPVPVTARPTEDIERLAATGEAVRPALEQALRGLPDLQGLRSVSAMQLDDGWYLNVDADIAPADDNEFTMPRIFTAVEGVVQPIINLRVNSYVNNQIRRLWLWEKGEWTAVTVGN
jgi:hypothetical protein